MIGQDFAFYTADADDVLDDSGDDDHNDDD